MAPPPVRRLLEDQPAASPATPAATPATSICSERLGAGDLLLPEEAACFPEGDLITQWPPNGEASARVEVLAAAPPLGKSRLNERRGRVPSSPPPDSPLPATLRLVERVRVPCSLSAGSPLTPAPAEGTTSLWVSSFRVSARRRLYRFSSSSVEEEPSESGSDSEGGSDFRLLRRCPPRRRRRAKLRCRVVACPLFFF